MENSNKWYMAGTEGTGEYVVIAQTPRGRVGFREFYPGNFRIRIEPAKVKDPKMAKMLLREDGWKQPDHQPRYSIVVRNEELLHRGVKQGLVAIGCGIKGTEINPDAPEWARQMAPTSTGLLTRLRNTVKKMLGRQTKTETNGSDTNQDSAAVQ